MMGVLIAVAELERDLLIERTQAVFSRAKRPHLAQRMGHGAWVCNRALCWKHHLFPHYQHTVRRLYGDFGCTSI